MFVPVACSQCGKPFQVTEDAVGQVVACPWCQATVAALPVAAPPPVEVLSLDDDPPAAPPRPRFVRAIVVVGVVVAVAGLTFLVLRLGKFYQPDWTEFAPPDRSCRVLMPARPTGESVAANPHSPAIRGGERFVSRRWYLKFTASVGWADLDPERAKGVRAEDLIEAEVRRRREELGATTSRSAAYRANDHQGAEVSYDTPAGPRVELLLVVPTGPRPRLYVLAAEGGGAKADDPDVRRFFNSFRVTE